MEWSTDTIVAFSFFMLAVLGLRVAFVVGILQDSKYKTDNIFRTCSLYCRERTIAFRNTDGKIYTVNGYKHDVMANSGEKIYKCEPISGGEPIYLHDDEIYKLIYTSDTLGVN